jgi:hypothetical protein
MMPGPINPMLIVISVLLFMHPKKRFHPQITQITQIHTDFNMVFGKGYPTIIGYQVQIHP